MHIHKWVKYLYVEHIVCDLTKINIYIVSKLWNGNEILPVWWHDRVPCNPCLPDHNMILLKEKTLMAHFRAKYLWHGVLRMVLLQKSIHCCQYFENLNAPLSVIAIQTTLIYFWFFFVVVRLFEITKFIDFYAQMLVKYYMTTILFLNYWFINIISQI